MGVRAKASRKIVGGRLTVGLRIGENERDGKVNGPCLNNGTKRDYARIALMNLLSPR